MTKHIRLRLDARYHVTSAAEQKRLEVEIDKLVCEFLEKVPARFEFASHRIEP